ncbi:MAG: glycoside hydrolase family 10 protein, partial [Candidatus Izemoplasmataceae bacterium]
QHHAHMAGLEDDLHYALSVSHTIDARAMWHRPNEQTLAEIQSNLDLWESLGFNMIYVETLWSGYSSYPSELLDTHPDVSGNRYGDHGDDYLKAFIEEAHSRGIEVHAWNSIFFLGSERRPLSNVLTDNPDWRMVNHDGTRIQNSTIFGDPANLDLRNYLVRFHEEMFTNYDLDGMQFDYIRYPYLSDVDHPGTRTDSGYTETAMNRFKEEYDIEGDIKTLVEEDEEVFQKFIEFRKNQVTESLKAIRDAVFEINPEAEFSMAVVPEPDKAVREYYQEWPLWIENGYIDHIAPMVYHGDPDIVADKASIIQDIAHPLAFQYTGIAPVYFGYTPFDNQMQINEVHAIGAFGYAIFATHNVNGNATHEEALQKSSNRDKALLPHSDMELLIQAFVDKQKDKINNLYAPNDQMKDSEELRRMLDELLTENPLSNAADYMEIYNQLKVLKSYAPVLLETPAADRLTEDTERMMNLVDVKISRDLIQRELWHPENDSERPDPLALDYPDSNPDNDEQNDESEEDAQRQISKWSIPIMVASGALIAVLLGLFYKLKIRTP